MWKSVAIVVALIVVVSGADPLYVVPEPLVEVYSPKGFRISIPDSKDVKSVQFLVSFDKPIAKGESGGYSKELYQKEGGYWMYWNPDVIVDPTSVVYYKVVVNNRDLYWTKDGQQVVKEVIPLGDCEDGNQEHGQTHVADHGVPVVPVVPSTDDLEEKNLGRISGKKNSYRSSYSMYKNSEARPITRSSTSTTSGTFFVKPTGEVEASGYKKSSSYDSSRREGEEWQHSEQQLSAAEIEDLKRLHGQNFVGTSFDNSYRSPSSVGGRYEESYFKKETNSHSNPRIYQTGYADGSNGQFQSRYYTQESSSSSASSGLAQPAALQGVHQRHLQTTETRTPVVANSYEQSYFSQNSRNAQAQVKPMTLHGSVIETNEYQKSVPLPLPIPVPAVPESRSRNFEYSRQETRRVVSNGGSADTGYPLTDIEIGKSINEETGNVHSSVVASRRHYTGSIFTSIKSGEPNNPQECHLLPDVDYTPLADLRQVEKSVKELTCLAVLAENSLKEEIRLVRHQNSNLARKLELLELQVKDVRDSCQCSERAH